MTSVNERGSVRHAGLPLAAPLPPAAPPTCAQLAESGAPPLLDAPPPPALDAPLRSDATLAALEQLYAAYKVEHWACLEELRALHERFGQAGGQAVVRAEGGAAATVADAPPASGGQEQAAGSAGGGAGGALTKPVASADVLAAQTFRELMHALGAVQPRRGPSQVERAPHAGAGQHGQQGQQQQQPQDGGGTGGEAMDVDAEPQQQTGGDGPLSGAAASAGPRPQRRYGDATCGYGSDDEPATFSDAEDAVLGEGPLGAAAGPWVQRRQGSAGAGTSGSGSGGAVGDEQLAEWQRRFSGNAEGLAALEGIASAASALFMDAQGALGCLCGRMGRYLIRRTAVTLGRSTDSKGDVDVDLSKEGPAAKVSRLQAQLLLGLDGCFTLQNVGRRAVLVNGKPLDRGASAPLPHLSLLEAGGVQLLFLANSLAVQRALARTDQLVM